MFAAIAASLVALGVGATDSNSIVVRLDGKETAIKLAGVSAGDARAAAFAQCLVAGRVVRISGPRSAATVRLLDDTSVAAHVSEFLQTQTAADPCAVGKAAYQPVHTAARVAAAPPTAPRAATPTGKKPREVHLSFASGTPQPNALHVAPAPQTTNEWGNNYRAQQPAAAPVNTPTYQTPNTVQMYQPTTVQTYTPPTVSTSPGLTQAYPQSLPQQGAQPMPQGGTETVPTTTYPPPPPPPGQ